MIQQRRERAYVNYNNYHKSLKEKYGIDYNVDKISEAEREVLYAQIKDCNEADELYLDFINHNWQ